MIAAYGVGGEIAVAVDTPNVLVTRVEILRGLIEADVDATSRPTLTL
jgi:hypothetical protein